MYALALRRAKKAYKSHAARANRRTIVSPTVNKIRAASSTAKRVPISQNRAPVCTLALFFGWHCNFSAPIGKRIVPTS